MGTNKRIEWIDITKGIGICLVILGHTYRANDVLNWIYSFHMPLFFILSGWLRGINPSQCDKCEYFNKKFYALIIPLIIFLSLTFIYWFIIERNYREFDIGPMWFLPILFTVCISTEFLLMKSPNVKMIVLLCIFFICLFLYCTNKIEYSSFTAWICRYLGATIFYLCGILTSTIKTVKNFETIGKKTNIN